MSPFHTLPHTADIAISITGKSFEELCSEGIRALFSVTQPIPIAPDPAPCIRSGGAQGIDYETVFIALLSDVLFLSAHHREAYHHLQLTLTPAWAATWQLQGVPVHGFAGIDIKAVTYHDLHITQTQNLWHTILTLDI